MTLLEAFRAARFHNARGLGPTSLHVDFTLRHDATPFRDFIADFLRHLLGAAGLDRTALIDEAPAHLRLFDHIADLAIHPHHDRARRRARRADAVERQHFVARDRLR